MERIIGFDIDGVLTDEGNENDNIWHNTLCKYLGKEIRRKKDTYNFIEAYGISQDIIDDFLDEHLVDIYKNIRCAPGARETLRELQELNFKIILITARKDKFSSITQNWLIRNKISYTVLIHEPDKAPLAREKNIELFVEDNKKNTKQLVQYGIPVILVDKYHNRNLETDGKVYRVYNWEEIRENIIKFFNLNQKSKNIC